MTSLRGCMLYVVMAALAGCGGKSQQPAPPEPTPAEAPAAAALADADLGAVIRTALGTDPGDARYFDASFDLNGDGAAERLAYVAGPMVCGTGGCPMFIFTPGADGYRLVSELSVVQLPVRVAPRSSQGWRNLVVHVAGGGSPAGDVELQFAGGTYPSNPTVAPAEPVTDLSGTEILIPQFDSYTEGTAIAGAE